MTPWAIRFRPSAQKELKKLPGATQAQVFAALERLALELGSPGESHASDVRKMDGRPGEWRLRVGDYRVVFERQGDHLVVLVLKVGHRREVYRR